MSEGSEVLASRPAPSPRPGTRIEGVFVGLYPLDAALVDPTAVRARLRPNPAIAGIEIPWLGRTATTGLATRILSDSPHWRLTVTMIPWTMRRLRILPRYGLSSEDTHGRDEAARDVLQAARFVRDIEDGYGAGVVAATYVHTAPSDGSLSYFARSLDALEGAEWGACRVLTEHVDAPQPGQAPAKGFLQLQDEIAVLAGRSALLGLALNWGRCAIELRDGDRVREHVTAARESGRLESVTFSGAGSTASAIGDAWADAHLPLHGIPPWGDPSSILTPTRVVDTLRFAGDVPLVGVKVVGGTATDGWDAVTSAVEVVDSSRSVRAGAR